MPEHGLEKLLGAFSADTLTAEEKQQLYRAALQDQQLFDALADEQALRELLADPTVRRRLLQALNQTRTSGAGGSLSWLDWLRRPATLAYAGGLVTLVFAVVLGTTVYQESLREAVHSVATEEPKLPPPPAPAPSTAQPTSPAIPEPAPKAKENFTAAKELAKKDALLDQLAKGERATSAMPPEQKASDVVPSKDQDRRGQDESRRQAETPAALPGKTVEEVASSVDQKLAASSAPPPSAPAPMRTPTGAAADRPVTSTISARALYYGEAVARPDSGLIAQEQERAMRPPAESMPQLAKPERRADSFSQLGRMKGTVATVKPLGLRYRVVIRGADGQDREIDAAAAAKSGEQARLTVEVNQDAYLQVWATIGSSTPQLLFPDTDSGKISVQLHAGQRQQIPLPTEGGTVTARLSRVPFGPISRQEAMLLERPAPGQLQESVPQEPATYIVNSDPSPTVQLSVVIPVGAR